jgi:hypothetical protein
MNEQQVHPKTPLKIVLVVGVVMLLVGGVIGGWVVPEPRIIVERVVETYPGPTVTETIKKTVPGPTVTQTIPLITETVTETVTPPTETVFQTPEAPPPTTSGSGEWVTIATFKGVTSKNTEKIFIPVDYWRIKYSVSTSSDWPVFYIFVQCDDFSKTEMLDYAQTGTEVSYLHYGLDEFWFEINAANLNSWTIDVQTQK